MSTAFALQDDARSQAYYEREAREWGEMAGEQVRMALAAFMDELPYSGGPLERPGDMGEIRDRIMDVLCDFTPGGGMDPEAYFDALKGGA